jgi:HEAT repeat protein
MGVFPQLEAPRSLETLLEHFDHDPGFVPGVREAEGELWYSEVALKVAEHGEAGLDHLLAYVSSADEVRLGAILLAFGFLPPGLSSKRLREVREVLLTFLHDARPLLVMQAIDSLNQLGHGQDTGRVLALLKHKSPYVHGAILRFLQQHQAETAERVALSALGSPVAVVRMQALETLDELSCVEALPRVRRCLGDRDPSVQQTARAVLKHLEVQLVLVD